MADAVPVVFAVADSSISLTNAGLIVTSDVHARTCEPVRNPFFFDGTGFSGLAYDSASQLWATTSQGSGSTSSLVRLQVSSGRVAETVNVSASGQPLNIGDLAFDSATDTLLGIRLAHGGGSGGGELYAIDRATGEATLVGNTGLTRTGAIGIGSHGQLYVTSFDASNNTASLHTLDRTTAAVTSTIVLSNPLGQFAEPIGLSNETVDGLLIASDSRSSEVVSIDPMTGVRTVIDLAGAPFGVAGDVALIPFEHSRDLIYQQDFEHGAGGFTVDNSGGTIPGLWHLSVGRRDDGLINHTRVNSFYYGAFETNVGRGTYLRPFDHEGVITSPEIVIPAAGVSTLSFNYLLETRPQLDRDFVDVSIDNGTTITPILSRQDGTLPQTGRTKWLTATSELAAFAGQTIRVRFHFDTGDTPTVDPEGWYVDDFRITTISASANVGVSKTISDKTPNEGQWVTYTVTATNATNSPGTATNVVVTDTLPMDVTFESAIASEGSFEPATGRWTGLELNPGETQELHITAIVNAGTAGKTLTNTAVIEADQDDPDDRNNQASEEALVNSVDLSIDKVADDETPNVGQDVIYTLVATNRAGSNAAATGVTAKEMLPDGVTFVSASSPDFDPITHVWTIGSLEAGTSRSLMITVRVNPGTAGDTLVNKVTIEGDETDPNSINDMDTQTSTVNSVDLRVTKSSDNASPGVGDLVTFTIDVANDVASNAMATGVNVHDSVPEGLRVVAVSSGGVFNPLTREVTWSGVSVNIGQNAVFTVATLVEAEASGMLLRNIAVTKGNETDPDPTTNTDDTTIAIGSTIQFIAPLSVYRLNGPLAPASEIADLTPAAGLATIAGFKWHDINQNGVWDSGEVGRAGWQFFIDVDGDEAFDPQSETSVATDANGRYVFQDLAPGTYLVREVPTQLSAGIFEARSAHVFEITVAADEVFAGQFGVSEPPNFGVFDYSPFIRPADAFAARISNPTVVTSLTPWQVFSVNNTSTTELTITSFDMSQISGRGAEFIRIQRLSDLDVASDVVLPITVGVDASERFLVTYDPAIRDGDTVTEQFPDWLGEKRDTNPAHRFERGDRISIGTEQSVTFNVSLFGGSTYDSDISYDGVVNRGDISQFETSIRSGTFDPTSDINARCPNGAELVLASCAWPLNGPPARAIDLGDFGPLNRELGGVSARPPLLDLDPTDQSGAVGNDILSTTVAGVVKIAPDARFANNSSRILDSLIVTIDNPQAGDSLWIDPSATIDARFTFNGGPLADLGNTSTSITISGSELEIFDYTDVLRQITFHTSRTDGGVAIISVQSKGSLSSQDGRFSSVLSESEGLGNVAFARVIVPAMDPASLPVTTLSSDAVDSVMASGSGSGF